MKEEEVGTGWVVQESSQEIVFFFGKMTRKNAIISPKKTKALISTKKQAFFLLISSHFSRFLQTYHVWRGAEGGW